MKKFILVGCVSAFFSAVLTSGIWYGNIPEPELVTVYEEVYQEPVVQTVEKYGYYEFTNTEKISASIGRLNPKVDPIMREIYAENIVKMAHKYGFPPQLIVSIIHRESSFNPTAVSSVDCLGLMQIHPVHVDKFKKLGITLEEVPHINHNIQLGCMILREYLDGKKGNIKEALLRYVGGNHQSYVTDILNMTTNMIISDYSEYIKAQEEK